MGTGALGFAFGGGGCLGGIAGGSPSDLMVPLEFEASWSNFFRGGSGGGISGSSLSLCKLPHELKKVFDCGKRTGAKMVLLPQELLRSTSRNTLWSEEADTGGVDGVLGDVGADTVDSSSVSAILLKLILYGSLSRGVG